MQPRRVALGGGLLALLLLTPYVGQAQPAGSSAPGLPYETLQQDIESLKAGQKAIMNELQEMKKRLSAPAPREDRSPIRDLSATLNVADAFSLGDKQATLTLVEFTDYQ